VGRDKGLGEDGIPWMGCNYERGEKAGWESRPASWLGREEGDDTAESLPKKGENAKTVRLTG